MLMASRMLHVKKGSQQTRKEAAKIFHENGNDFGGLMVIGDGMGWVFILVIMATRMLHHQTRNEAAGDDFDRGSLFLVLIMVLVTLQME